MADTERTLVLIKPDAVRRGLVGAILERYERRGLFLEAMDLRRIDAATADAHYAEHVGKVWYPELRDFVTSGPLVAAVVAGEKAIEVIRTVNGATDPVVAVPGTIRGDFALRNPENLVHASDSQESAARELELFFPGDV